MQIRRMTEADAGSVAAIEKTIFTQPWSAQGFIDSLHSEYTIYVVAEEEGEILGYCGLLRSFEDADVTNMAVREDRQGQKIGQALLGKLMEEGRAQGIENFTLEVRVSNAPAIHMYEKLGYKTEGIRKNFYALPTEDAAIMWARSGKDGE